MEGGEEAGGVEREVEPRLASAKTSAAPSGHFGK